MPFSIPVEATVCLVCGAGESSPEASGSDYMYGSCPDTFTHVRCLGCGHIYLDPRPCREAAAIIYPSTYASFAGTLAKPSLMSWIKRLVVMRRLRGVLGSMDRPRILEIGCGEGQLLLAIRDTMPEAKLAGLDFHFRNDFAGHLRSRNIEVITGLAEDVDLPESHYDLVIMNQLIEHLWDADRVLQACWRALKPAGMLSIETPNSGSYDRALFRKGLWGDYYYPRHFNLFSRAGLTTVLRRNGFETVKSYPLLAPLCWVFTMHSIAGAYPSWSWLRKVFTMTSIPAIALFTMIDIGARAVGLETSNQKAIARKIT